MQGKRNKQRHKHTKSFYFHKVISHNHLLVGLRGGEPAS